MYPNAPKQCSTVIVPQRAMATFSRLSLLHTFITSSVVQAHKYGSGGAEGAAQRGRRRTMAALVNVDAGLKCLEVTWWLGGDWPGFEPPTDAMEIARISVPRCENVVAKFDIAVQTRMPEC